MNGRAVYPEVPWSDIVGLWTLLAPLPTGEHFATTAYRCGQAVGELGRRLSESRSSISRVARVEADQLGGEHARQPADPPSPVLAQGLDNGPGAWRRKRICAYASDRLRSYGGGEQQGG